jgi:hypothetical protein
MWVLPMVIIRMVQKFHLALTPGQVLHLRHSPVLMQDEVIAAIQSRLTKAN